MAVTTAIDKHDFLGYVAFEQVVPQNREWPVPVLRKFAKLLQGIGLVACVLSALPLGAQQPRASADLDEPTSFPATIQPAPSSAGLQGGSYIHAGWMLGAGNGYILQRPFVDPLTATKFPQNSSPGTIDRMEAAFYCNDTPFVDQVRLPLATLWRGRVKLIGFESDVTTANFVLGLPGQGALHNLSMFGTGFVATHTPPSDQMAGIHMTFSLRGSDTRPEENSGLRGIQYLVRSSRGVFPFFGIHAESAAPRSR
jgi:hypothetical protein